MQELIATAEAAIRSALSTEFAQGGLVLMALGSVLALARNLPGRLLSLLQRQFVVSVDVVSGDPLFGWLTIWLDRQPYSTKARRITAAARFGDLGVGGHNPNEPARVLFTPAPGFHVFWVDGRPIWMTRERKETPGRDGGWSTYQETITLRMFGRSPEVARKILESARDLAYDRHRVGVYIQNYGDWSRLHEIRPRPLSSVILPAGMIDDLIADVGQFLEAEDWYRERGIPWRRGYLLEGIPGAGKTSTIMALAGHLSSDLYVCNVADRGLDDERLFSALLNVKERSIVLLEDIDAVVNGRKVDGDNGVTFSGLLNALDGVASRPGVMTFLTSNHAENLDPALVRAGRVDRRIVFGPATQEQVERFFLHFYGDDESLRPLARRFAVQNAGKAIADIQGLLLEHRDNPQAVTPNVVKESA